MDVYLYGDVTDTLVAVTRPFVAAARRGGGDASIAVLMQGGADSVRYFRDYRRHLLAAGADEVTTVPHPTGRADEAGIEVIGSCSGIFMAGGHVKHESHELPEFDPDGDLERRNTRDRRRAGEIGDDSVPSARLWPTRLVLSRSWPADSQRWVLGSRGWLRSNRGHVGRAPIPPRLEPSRLEPSPSRCARHPSQVRGN
ncbi:MAG: hypothetical protein H0V96_08625 [Acidimicrobiia bacterium]|nr:hypothetical protein [Acidimicrobiia bacterium]